MTSSKDIPLIRNLLTEHPQFVRKRRLLIHPPLSHSLRGLYFEPSAFAKGESYVWEFIMPLCVPLENMVFDLGDRLGSGTRTWRHESEADFRELSDLMSVETEPQFESLVAASSVLKKLSDMSRKSTNANYVEAHGYFAARYGDQREAMKSLKILFTLVPPEQPWDRERLARAERLLNLLDSDPEGVRRLLDEWRLQTLQNLKLTDLAVGPE